MAEKKSIKVGFGTTVCVFLIFFLVLGMVAMYYFGFVKRDEKISNLEAQKVALQEEINSLQQTKSTIESQTPKTDDEIMSLIKKYILTDFGPQNNMKSVTIHSYKEITPEEYFSETPGSPLTEEEKAEFLKKNPDLMYGFCTFTIELIDANKLTMEGSSATYQEIVGNKFNSEAIFTLNKTTNEINFATSYGFGNTPEGDGTISKDSDEQIKADIKNWILAQLKALNDANSEKLLDYRVDSVRILDDTEKREMAALGYESTDILAYVRYSVKPENINNSRWASGNGGISGDWIVDKSVCICWEDGKAPEIQQGMEYYGLGATGW